jgi:hypothetical protein
MLSNLWGGSLPSLDYLSFSLSRPESPLNILLSLQEKSRINWVKALSLAKLYSHTLPMALSCDSLLCFWFKIGESFRDRKVIEAIPPHPPFVTSFYVPMVYEFLHLRLMDP